MKFSTITYRIFALSMAILMLATSIHYSVEVHFCQGHFKSLSFWGKAKNCHELAKANPPCKHHQQKLNTATSTTQLAQKDCCQNKNFQFQLEQDRPVITSPALPTSSLQHFLFAYVLALLTTDATENTAPRFAHYKPPLIPEDILLLRQSFLL